MCIICGWTRCVHSVGGPAVHNQRVFEWGETAIVGAVYRSSDVAQTLFSLCYNCSSATSTRPLLAADLTEPVICGSSPSFFD